MRWKSSVTTELSWKQFRFGEIQLFNANLFNNIGDPFIQYYFRSEAGILESRSFIVTHKFDSEGYAKSSKMIYIKKALLG